MGLYARLRDATVPCLQCGALCSGNWQFYFGSVASLPEYRLGDRISWDPATPRFGDPEMTIVYAVAYSDVSPPCAICSSEFLAEIAILDGVLHSIRPLTKTPYLRALIYEGEERMPRDYHDL